MYTVNRCKTLMGYILYVSLFTVVIFSGNRHGALLRVNILLLTIFVMKSSYNHVLSRNRCIFMVLTLLETTNYHCIAIVRMVTNVVYFNLKYIFFGCSRLIIYIRFARQVICVHLLITNIYYIIIIIIFKCEKKINCVGASYSK